MHRSLLIPSLFLHIDLRFESRLGSCQDISTVSMPVSQSQVRSADDSLTLKVPQASVKRRSLFIARLILNESSSANQAP